MTTSIVNYEESVAFLKSQMSKREGGNFRLLTMLGELENPHQTTEQYPNKSMYNHERYQFFLDAPFEISNRCCNVMKKSPAHEYGRKTGRKPILATMAEESRLRTQKWLQQGCNAFEATNPTSAPMSFWTNNDVLQYIKENNVEICSVYGDIVPDYCGKQLEGQMDFCDLGLAEDNRKLKTTGCDRTGCMFCGFGCHFGNDQRFVRMKETHPKQYEFIMKPKEQGGLGYKEVIDWINEHGNLYIKY